MAVDLKRHRFSLEQYERMARTGVLTENDRVELIAGEILDMVPIDPPHSIPVQRLARFFFQLGDRAYVRVQDEIRIPPDSQPQPDIALARPPDTRYTEQHPGPEDLFLVVEVAHATQLFDRNVKLPLYGRAGIPEVWIVDVSAAQVEIYRRPSGGAYASVEVLSRHGVLTPQAFPDLHIAVDDVFPASR